MEHKPESRVKYIGETYSSALRGTELTVQSNPVRWDGTIAVATPEGLVYWVRPDLLIPYRILVTTTSAISKDNGSKPNPALLFQDFAFALAEVAKTLDQGAKKYPRGNWAKLPEAKQQYTESFTRHWQKIMLNGLGSVNTKDGVQLDLDHAIMNLIFVRQLMHLEAKGN